MTAEKRYALWMEKLPKGDPLYAELKAVRGDDKEINDRFSGEMMAATGGDTEKRAAGSYRPHAFPFYTS